jgi:hypothetical protein
MGLETTGFYILISKLWSFRVQQIRRSFYPITLPIASEDKQYVPSVKKSQGIGY